jgi:hypothetical protein
MEALLGQRRREVRLAPPLHFSYRLKAAVKSFQFSSSAISSAAVVMKVYSSGFFSAAVLRRSPNGNTSGVSHSIESRS